MLVRGAGRALHDVRRGFLRAEGERREQVGAEVDGQDLHDGERQRDAEQDVAQVGDQLRYVGGEDVGDEVADVLEDGAPLLYGMHDGGEVVIQKHDVCSLAGHAGPGEPHRDADMGLFQGRRIVHAVTGDRYPVPSLDQQAYHMHLVLRRHPGKDKILLIQFRPQYLVRHAGALPPLDDDGLAGCQADLPGDGRRGGPRVSGDHDHLDAGAAAAAQRLRHLGTRRVQEPHESGKAESLFRDVPLGEFVQLPVCQGYDPKPLGSHGPLPLQESSRGALPLHRDVLACLAKRRAQRHHLFACPLDEHEQFPLDPVQGGHALSLGIEGDFCQPLAGRAPLGGCELVQRRLRRVSLEALGGLGGVVAEPCHG